MVISDHRQCLDRMINSDHRYCVDMVVFSDQCPDRVVICNHSLVLKFMFNTCNQIIAGDFDGTTCLIIGCLLRLWRICSWRTKRPQPPLLRSLSTTCWPVCMRWDVSGSQCSTHSILKRMYGDFHWLLPCQNIQYSCLYML